MVKETEAPRMPPSLLAWMANWMAVALTGVDNRGKIWLSNGVWGGGDKGQEFSLDIPDGGAVGTSSRQLAVACSRSADAGAAEDKPPGWSLSMACPKISGRSE